MIFIYNYKIFLFINKNENINKFVYNNIHQIPILDKLIVNCSVHDNNLQTYWKSLLLIEIITTIKPFVIIKKKYNKGKKNAIVFFTSTSIIRKEKILNVMYYLVFFIKPNLKRKMIKFINKIIKQNIFFFKLNDIISFPGFSENFDKFKIIINFYLSIKNIKYKFITNKFINILGF
jgi:hypothetical protein